MLGQIVHRQDFIRMNESLTDVLHALSEHHFVEDLASLHTNKAVIHFRLPKWLERLDIIELGFFTIEGWTRNWPPR